MKKEAKRLEKEAKLAAKAAKMTVAAAAPPGADKKAKDKKDKKDEDLPFVNTTPPGHKKGACPAGAMISSKCMC